MTLIVLQVVKFAMITPVGYAFRVVHGKNFIHKQGLMCPLYSSVLPQEGDLDDHW